MKYKIVITNTAIQDIKKISSYIANTSGEVSIAQRYVQELKTTIYRLETFPEIGSFPKDKLLKATGYRYIIHKDYLLFYTIDKKSKTVYVMTIINAKQDYNRVLKNSSN